MLVINDTLGNRLALSESCVKIRAAGSLLVCSHLVRWRHRVSCSGRCAGIDYGLDVMNTTSRKRRPAAISDPYHDDANRRLGRDQCHVVLNCKICVGKVAVSRMQWLDASHPMGIHRTATPKNPTAPEIAHVGRFRVWGLGAWGLSGVLKVTARV